MFLVDTNVVSELRKVRAGKADERVSRWSDSVDAADLYLSAITIHELEIGVLLAERKDPPQGRMLRAWFSDHVLVAFDGRILPIDAAVAQRSAQLNVPNPRPLHDGLIAATALVHGMTVVTRNVADFAPTGARILDPWNA
jgi:hypothetical protein